MANNKTLLTVALAHINELEEQVEALRKQNKRLELLLEDAATLANLYKDALSNAHIFDATVRPEMTAKKK